MEQECPALSQVQCSSVEIYRDKTEVVMSKENFASVSRVGRRRLWNAWQGKWENVVNNKKLFAVSILEILQLEMEFLYLWSLELKRAPKWQIRMPLFPLSPQDCDLWVKRNNNTETYTWGGWVHPVGMGKYSKCLLRTHPFQQTEKVPTPAIFLRRDYSSYSVTKKTDFWENCGGIESVNYNFFKWGLVLTFLRNAEPQFCHGFEWRIQSVHWHYQKLFWFITLMII